MLQIARSAAWFSLAITLAANVARANERIDLSPRRETGSAVRVSIALEAGGNALVRNDSDAKQPGDEKQLPMSVSAKIDYEERRLASPVASAGTPLAVRHYERAEAILKVDDSGRAPQLAADRRLIVLENSTERPILYCPDGPLSREQLDLVDVLGNSIIADQLLPKKPVADGDTWGHDSAEMGALLALDTVAVCEAESVLEGFNASFAKARLAGVIHGTADGAATQLEVRALYLFDRKARRITQLNLAVREKRSIGGATPGLDAVAKLQIKIEPLAAPVRLNDKAAADATAALRMPLRDLVYEAAPLGFRVHHDRQWFVTSEQRESVTLRRVDRGDLVAQCTLSALPAKSAGRQVSLEQFQKDVTYSLGKNFGELVSSRQWQNAAGHYCYELVARGLVEEVPVEWHYYLVAPESGHRVSAAVTIEKPMVERVGGADRQLIESLELIPQMPAAQTAARPIRKTTK